MPLLPVCEALGLDVPTVLTQLGVTPTGVQALTSSSSGVTRFELWARVARPVGEARAGYSASAEVELALPVDAAPAVEVELEVDAAPAIAVEVDAAPAVEAPPTPSAPTTQLGVAPFAAVAPPARA